LLPVRAIFLPRHSRTPPAGIFTVAYLAGGTDADNLSNAERAGERCASTGVSVSGFILGCVTVKISAQPLTATKVSRMRRFSRLSFVLCALTLAGVALGVRPAYANGDIKAEVAAVLAQKSMQKGAVGIEIIKLGESAGDDHLVFEHNAHDPRIPASNLKLVTTSAALAKFGPDFKFKTVLMKRADDLVLVGDGDPTLGDAEYLKTVGGGWGVTTVFQAWAKQLAARGITTVDDVIVDDTVFDDQFLHPHWPADQEHKRYVAQVGGINLNANCIDFYIRGAPIGSVVSYVTDPATHYADVRNACVASNQNAIWLSRELNTNKIVLRGESPKTGVQVPVSVTIHDPPMYAGTVLAETLAASGIKIRGHVRRDRTLRAEREKGGAGWSILAIHETPLLTVIARANKDSMNLYAESLCKRLGFATTGQSGSWQNGTAAVGQFLKTAGVGDTEFKLDDGCGLSKENVISPHAIIRVLAYDYHSANRQKFIETLSIGGIDGTLEDRFRGTDLKGRVFGKSGYVVGVRSLSGYLRAKDGHFYAFSILMNKVPEDGTPKPLQERIVKAIDDHAAVVAAGQ
jgi:D-alanyl-D-alanine carboxypeptidase/D-alanyl-D-alanine-endopeptidase (penicillin-binding protein 4)